MLYSSTKLLRHQSHGRLTSTNSGGRIGDTSRKYGYSSRKPVSSITFFLSPETGDRPASRHSEHHHACRKDYHGSFTTRHISSCLVPSTSQSAWRNDYLCERQFLLYATSCYLFSHTLFLRKDLAALSSPLTFRRCSVFRHPFP